jgi:hypothetical protein
MRRAHAFVVALTLAACGGSSSESSEAAAPAAAAPAASGADRQAQSERKLRAAQASAIAAMCERLVDCSVEDAKRTMSPKELEELKPAELVPKARTECEGDYGTSSLSPRQIRTIQGCVNQSPDCAALTTCLEDVAKRP